MADVTIVFLDGMGKNWPNRGISGRVISYAQAELASKAWESLGCVWASASQENGASAGIHTLFWRGMLLSKNLIEFHSHVSFFKGVTLIYFKTSLLIYLENNGLRAFFDSPDMYPRVAGLVTNSLSIKLILMYGLSISP